jgi:hypothetical protein
MNINPIVLPIRMWQASMEFWQGVAVAQLQMNRCALTMMGLWPSEKIKSLGTAKAKPAANRPEAVPVAKAETPTTVKAEPAKAEKAKVEPVTAEPVKAEKVAPSVSEAAPTKAAPAKVAAAKVAPVRGEAAPAKPVRRKAAAGGQTKPKAAPRRKAPAKAAEPAPLSDTRH